MMDKRLLALVPGALRHVLLTVAWQFAGLVSNVCFVWGICRVLSSLVEGTPAPLVLCIPLIVVGIAGRVVAARMASRVSFEASADVKRITRRRIYEKLLRLGPHYADSIATAINSLEHQGQALQLKYQLSALQGDSKQALEYFVQADALEDSVRVHGNSSQMMNARVNYERQRRQAEFDLINRNYESERKLKNIFILTAVLIVLMSPWLTALPM